MLVLQRRQDEQIVIGPVGGQHVVITICSVRGELVRVGVDADPDVAVHRREIWERIHGRARPRAARPRDRKVT